jgi:hypothetical protein
MRRLGGLTGLAIVAFLAATPARAAETQTAGDPLRIDTGHGFVKFGLMAGVQFVAERRSFWELGRAFAPGAAFQSSMNWGEAYAKPSVIFEHKWGAGIALYGGLSAIGARTLGRDVFDSREQGRLLLEDAYVGMRIGEPAGPFRLDLSIGAQPYRIGSGMLIADGASDGFERGAIVFGPRQAFSMTAIAKAGFGPLTVEAFHLDPNELQSGDTATRIVGGKAEWAFGPNQFAGIAYGRTTVSDAPYPKAAAGGLGPPAILDGGRDGLRFAQGYFRLNPIPQLPGLWLAGDLALQWNGRIDMRAWGARAEIGHAFADLPWRPSLSWSYQTFSGDDPRTPRLERFDPLLYDGSPPGWATGSNGSFVFINSNVNAHRLTLALNPSPQDIVTLRYAHVRANALDSPVQFGQATRLTMAGPAPALIAGVRKRHLSDDFLVEYTRIVTQNMFLTAGLAHSIPGEGLRDAATPRRLSPWTGAFSNLVVRY